LQVEEDDDDDDKNVNIYYINKSKIIN